MQWIRAVMVFWVTVTHLQADSSEAVQAEISHRIIGGSVASTAPEWMASIQTQYGHFCGGSLIGAQWVITAAHCLERYNADQLSVKLGGSALESIFLEHHEIDWFYIHPEFNPSSFLHDIAIIKLKQSSQLTPLMLADNSLTSTLSEDPLLTVYGWGVTSIYDSELPSELQTVDVTFQTDAICGAVYGNKPEYWQYFLCAGEPSGGKDSCQGDSGGPLIQEINGVPALVGIVSWGESCALRKKYGVYTEVSAYLKWIEQRRRGLTILGDQQLGFLGEGMRKAEWYRLINLSSETLHITEKSIEGTGAENFLINEAEWIIDSKISSTETCQFRVDAYGTNVGTHHAQIKLSVDDPILSDEPYQLLQPIQSRVLSSLGNQSATMLSDSEPLALLSSESVRAINTGNEWHWFVTRDEETQQTIWLTYLNGAALNSLTRKWMFRVDQENVDRVSTLHVNGAEAEVNSYHNYAGVPLFDGINEIVFHSQANVADGVQNFSARRMVDICHLDSDCSGSNRFSDYRTDVENVKRAITDESVVEHSEDIQINDFNPCDRADYVDSEIHYLSRDGQIILAGENISGGGVLGHIWQIVGLLFVLFKFRLQSLLRMIVSGRTTMT